MWEYSEQTVLIGYTQGLVASSGGGFGAIEVMGHSSHFLGGTLLCASCHSLHLLEAYVRGCQIFSSVTSLFWVERWCVCISVHPFAEEAVWVGSSRLEKSHSGLIHIAQIGVGGLLHCGILSSVTKDFHVLRHLEVL